MKKAIKILTFFNVLPIICFFLTSLLGFFITVFLFYYILHLNSILFICILVLLIKYTINKFKKKQINFKYIIKLLAVTLFNLGVVVFVVTMGNMMLSI